LNSTRARTKRFRCEISPQKIIVETDSELFKGFLELGKSFLSHQGGEAVLLSVPTMAEQ
jgi:hypothetical protein